jgi:hypothetical protein
MFEAPLTRTYTSRQFLRYAGAFGKNASLPFDSAPTGERFPNTYRSLTLVLEDGTYLFFDRVTPGT